MGDTKRQHLERCTSKHIRTAALGTELGTVNGGIWKGSGMYCAVRGGRRVAPRNQQFCGKVSSTTTREGDLFDDILGILISTTDAAEEMR